MAEWYIYQMASVKIGDVLEARLENGDRRYFQYIARGSTALASNFIRVFKGRYGEGVHVKLAKVVRGGVDFEVTTTLIPGINRGYWKTVANMKHLIDHSAVEGNSIARMLVLPVDNVKDRLEGVSILFGPQGGMVKRRVSEVPISEILKKRGPLSGD
jgi:hypothetical protein